MTQPYVLTFVGENANGILRWWTEQVLIGFERHGLSGRVIDLKQPGWQDRMNESLALARPAFCFSFQGMGMGLQLPSGENFWSSNAVPFLSYLGDSPYHAPALHAAEGPGLYLLYGCADFLQTYQAGMRGRTYATTVQLGYPANPYAGRTPFHKRDHSMVFVKSGVDPASLSRAWMNYPVRIRDILFDSAKMVLTGADETIASICARIFRDRQIEWGDRREFFLSTCSLVDRYIRAVKADTLVRALMRHDALIVGDWSHLDQSSARARFAKPVAADDLDALYAETRILFNTGAGSRFGVHERVVAGLMARAAVISDSTPFVQDLLQGCPSFYGISLDENTSSDALDQAIEACLRSPETQSNIEISFEVARCLFSLDLFIQTLLEHVELESYRRTVHLWSMPHSHDQPLSA